MKVIVTGGNGRIGKAVIETLDAKGHELVSIDRRPAYDRPAKFVYMDLRERERLQPVMEQAEAVIHMGEIPDVGMGHHTDEEVFGHNTTGSSLVLQLAAELKYKRIIYASTIQVYGSCGTNAVPWAMLPIDETCPLRPKNAYGAGKVAIETYARMLCDTKGCSIAAFRLPGVSIEGHHEHWFHWADENTSHLPGHFGIQVRDRDIAECFAKVLESGQKPGFEAYQLSSREVCCGIPLARGIEKFLPDFPRLPADWPMYKSPYLWDKAKAHFDWEPKWNFMDEFRRRFGREPKAAALFQ